METRRGKGAALNRLAELAQGELLLFTDAHTHIGAGCLRRVVRHFADGRVGCVTGDTHSWRQDSAVLRKGAQVYLDYETIIRHLESEIGSVLTCDGGIFCMRRSLFEPLCPELANDLELPLRVGRAGYWVRHEPEARACEKESPSLWESFRQRRRISAQGMLAMWKLRGLLDCLSGWQFVSRKLLRWLTLVPIALVTVSAFMLSGRPVFAAILMLQTVFYGSALAGLNLALSSRRAGPLVCAPFYVLLASLSALVGVVDVCLGRRYAVWESPALARGQDQETWQSVH
jgi:cellulose synthase/poly-beta-1,6-N-acetylglucosamine synthase-like glycosyltransferase